MEQTNKSKKGVIIGVIALVVVVAVLAIVYSQMKPQTTEGSKSIQVQVVYEDETSKTFDYQTNEEYLGAVLLSENLIAGSESEYGFFMTTVDGVTADDATQQWWSLTKGGEMSVTSVDATPIEDGDVYELTLVTGW